MGFRGIDLYCSMAGGIHLHCDGEHRKIEADSHQPIAEPSRRAARADDGHASNYRPPIPEQRSNFPAGRQRLCRVLVLVPLRHGPLGPPPQTSTSQRRQDHPPLCTAPSVPFVSSAKSGPNNSNKNEMMPGPRLFLRPGRCHCRLTEKPCTYCSSTLRC